MSASSTLLSTLITVGLWRYGQGSEKSFGHLAQAGCRGVHRGARPRPYVEEYSLPFGLADGELEAPEP